MFKNFFNESLESIYTRLTDVELRLTSFRDRKIEEANKFEAEAFEAEQRAAAAHGEVYKAERALSKIREIFNVG